MNVLLLTKHYVHCVHQNSTLYTFIEHENSFTELIK